MSRKPIAAALLAVALIGTMLVVGCGKQDAPRLSSPWPFAEKERTVPKPPEPPRWPYTGKRAKDEASIRRRPLSIKIENSQASRPQTGLNSADVVYETISEGGITRFNCIFQSKIPKVVGPVRSARLSDLYIVPQYDALFFFSGAHSSVEREVNKAGLPNLSQDAGVMAPYSRSSARSAPHNLYLNTEEAYRTAKKRGHKITADLQPLQFLKASRETTVEVTEINVPFSNYNKVKWVYDDGSYKRFNSGAAHMDARTGNQVNAKNVVVLWAKYEPVRRDKVGSNTFRVILGGKGRVSIFHDGQRHDGTWVANRTAPPKFKDKDGKPIKLASGRTWFQVLPLDASITMK